MIRKVRRKINMKKIKYLIVSIIFSVLFSACSTMIAIYQVATWKPKILVDLNTEVYSVYKNGKFTRDGLKEKDIEKLSYQIVDNYGLRLYNGRIGVRGEYSRIIFYDDIKVTINNKTVIIPPIMLKNTIEIYWLENAFHPDIKDIYYHYWLDKYKGEFGDVKKISSNPELVEIPNDIKKIIEEKKKLSDIEIKVGETRQGKVITNDTNLFITTWEKVDK